MSGFSRPFNGIRIVEYVSANCELSVRLAVALAGRIATDLGASVTVIAEPNSIDLLDVPPHIDGRSALSLFLDRGKASQSAARGEGDRLVDAADVLLCDDGVALYYADRAGKQIQTIVSLMPPGVTAGPQSEFTVMALGGLLDLVGHPQREPLRLGGHQLAYSAGLAAFMGTIGALCLRDAGGPKDELRINLADVAVWLNWKGVGMSGAGASPASRQGDDAEWRVMRCRDGWVALVYSEPDWPALRALIGSADLDDPALNERAARRRSAALINRSIEEAFAGKTRAELHDAALAARLPLGPVWSPADLREDPQYVARQFFGLVQTGKGGPVFAPRLPMLWNGEPAPVASAEPEAA